MTLGVTGHQALPPDQTRLKASLYNELSRFGPGVGLTSLAAGSDQIFATIALDMGWTLEAIIPCHNYMDTFSDATARQNYRRLLGRCEARTELPYDFPSEIAFLKAGHYIVDHVDRMVFVWDGRPAKGLGGTADIVQYATERKLPYFLVNPLTAEVNRHEPAT